MDGFWRTEHMLISRFDCSDNLDKGPSALVWHPSAFVQLPQGGIHTWAQTARIWMASGLVYASWQPVSNLSGICAISIRGHQHLGTDSEDLDGLRFGVRQRADDEYSIEQVCRHAVWARHVGALHLLQFERWVK